MGPILAGLPFVEEVFPWAASAARALGQSERSGSDDMIALL